MDHDDLLIEFSRLLDNYEIADEQARQSFTSLVEQCLEENHWRNLDHQGLLDLLFESISLYGQTNWEPFAQIIGPIYLHAMEHLPVEARRDLQGAIRNRIEDDGTSLNALMPFLFLETDMGVVSTAALDFAMIPKPPEDDPVGWPRRLIADLQAGMGGNKGALLGGLIALGDKRVNGLLQEVKWLISDDEIDTAVKCTTGMPTVAAFAFWLAWAEELVDADLDDSGLFGEIASGMVNLIRFMRTESILDISRNFGYLSQADEGVQSMVVHRQYSKAELADHFSDRVYALEEAERPPKLMSDVIRNMGLEPRAPLEERHTIQ